MLSGFNRPFITLLVLAILFSSNGLVLSLHTCLANNSKEIELFSEQSCCMDMEDCHNEGSGKEKKVNETCCSSEYSYLKTANLFLCKKDFQTSYLYPFERSFSAIFNRADLKLFFSGNNYLNKTFQIRKLNSPMLI